MILLTRYKEVNGLVLRNFGRELKNSLNNMDGNEVFDFFSDLPKRYKHR